MSKKLSIILIALTLVLVMVIPSSRVFAADLKVKTVDVTEASGKYTVSGTVDAGMLAVSVEVVDKDGNFVKLVSGAVDADNKYSVDISTVETPFTVKVANYDGGETISKDVGYEEIEEINLTLEVPVEGTEIKMVEVTDEYGTYTTQQNKPVVKAEDGAKYKVWMPTWILGTSTSTDIPEGKNWYEPFEGTVEAEKYYYAVVSVSANDGCKFKDGLKIKVNGEDPAELFGIYGNTDTDFIVKVKAVEKASEEATEDSEDDATEVTPKTGDNITIFFAIFAVAAVGTITVITLNRKNVKTKKSSKH